MVLSLIYYAYYVLKHDRTSGSRKKDASISKAREISNVLGCLLVVFISGRFTVSSAVEVAWDLGVTE